MDKENKILSSNNKINNYCKIFYIKNKYILKLIFSYQNVLNCLKLLRLNKSLQKSIGLSLTSYKIYSYYKKNKINMFDFKKLEKFSQNIKSKLKECASLEHIYYNLSLCMIDNFYSNINMRKNNNNIIDLNMLYEELYLIYKSLLQNFSFHLKINLFYSDKFFIDKIYLEKYYQNFINNYKNFINGISFEIYDKNITKSIIDNNFHFIKNNLFGLNINRIKFSKIKFNKDEMQLIKLFSIQNLNDLYFISCKFSFFSIELISRYLSKENNKLTKILFNDCHINNKIIEKLIYWSSKDIDLSFNKNILNNLEKLDLSGNKINDLGFSQLLLYFNSNNSFYNQNLKYLNLNNNKLGHNSIKYLLNIDDNYNLNNKILEESEKLKGLYYLDLSNNPFGNIAKLIFTWKNNTLTHLILKDCNIGNYNNENNENNFINNEDLNDEEQSEYINENKNNCKYKEEYLNDVEIILGLSNLLYLNISNNQLSPNFLKFLFYDIPNLYCLNISSCYIESSSFEEINKINNEIKIKKLIMSHNYIKTQDIINLYEYGIFSTVEQLDLFDNNLKDEIVPFLINNIKIIKLKRINIDLNFGIERINNSLLYQYFIRYNKFS